MNAQAAVVSKMFSLTRGDLESAVFPTPQPISIFRENVVVRLLRVASFWRHSAFPKDSLLSCTADLLASFHSQCSPFLSMICGEARSVEYMLGGPKGMFGKPALSAVLRSILPGCMTDEQAGSLEDRFTILRHAAILTGSPQRREPNRFDALPDQIEKLIRGMQGRRWAFLIYAHPISAMVVMRTINEVTSEIRDVRSTFLLKQSPIDEQDRIAQRYVELLEAKLRRYEAGRAHGMWQAQMILFTEDAAALALGQALLHGAFANEKSLLDPVRCHPCSPQSNTPPSLEALTTDELAVFARMPQEEYAGYEVVDYVRYGVEVPTPDVSLSRPVTIGDVLDRGLPVGNPLRLTRSDFTKHGLIVGITGSGKTKTCMSLLQQLWDRGQGVPFLVIESAKSEYRNLRTHPDFANLKVFTIADETISPLRLNPFEAPPNVLVQTHIDYMKSLFSAAFVLYPPMPYVLEQSLQEIYEDRGWDLAQNRNLRGHSPRAFPTLSDLVGKIPVVIERMGYDERITMDVKAGLLARINQLRLGGGKGLMFDVRQSFDNDLLFGSPCVLELKNLVSDDEKAFLIGLILIRLYETCEGNPQRQDGQLHHVTLIEEAHRLLRNTSTEQSAEVANPRGRAIEVFANILSEIRAYGEGILIAEQVPTKLTPDAVKNTSLKVVHRLLADDDRQLVGKSINLDEDQTRGLSLLATGDAVVFAEGLQKSVLTHIPLFARTDQATRVGLEELRGARERLLGPCRYCTTIGVSCRGYRAIIGDVFLLTFRRLVNALRFSADHAGAYYTRLLHSHASELSNASIPLHCVLARLAEAECDRRGQFHGWSFELVDRAMNALLDEFDALAVGKSLVGTFAAVLDETYSSLPRPFPGCACCRKVCHYRFDTSIPGKGEQSEFRETFLKAPVPWNRIAALCLPAFNTMPLEAVKARQEAALCFGIQQLHTLGISAQKQQQYASQLANHLSLEA